ncbi:MAG TPA: hypothetical protein VIL18_02150 [Longimicrobiales bacterium]
MADLKDEEYQAMLAHFRAAHRFDPGNVDAAVALLGRLADIEAWEEFVAVARRLELVAPDDPRTHLFVGLGLHERGHGEAVDQAFSRALAPMRPDERRIFQDISALLRRSVRPKYADMDSAGRAEARRVLRRAGSDLPHARQRAASRALCAPRHGRAEIRRPALSAAGLGYGPGRDLGPSRQARGGTHVLLRE